MRFLIAIGAIAFSTLGAGFAQAGAISSLVPGLNVLEDTDFELATDANGNLLGPGAQIVPGTKFLGAIRIDNVLPSNSLPGGADPVFTGIFGIQAIASVDRTGSNTVYFAPLDSTDWSAEFGLTPGTITASDANTMLIMYDDVLRGDTYTGVPPTTGLSLQDAIETFQGANMAWEFGFDGTQEVNANGAFTTDQGEFWAAEGPIGSDILGANLDQLINIINLSVTAQGAGPLLNDHDFLATQGFENTAGRAGVSFFDANQFQAEGTVELVTAEGPFPIVTDTNLYINVVPEPGSFAIFALIGGCAIGVRGRRRREV